MRALLLCIGLLVMPASAQNPPPPPFGNSAPASCNAPATLDVSSYSLNVLNNAPDNDYYSLPPGALVWGVGSCTVADAQTCRAYCNAEPSCVAYETGTAVALAAHGVNCCLETTVNPTCYLPDQSTSPGCQCNVYPGVGAPADQMAWQTHVVRASCASVPTSSCSACIPYAACVPYAHCGVNPTPSCANAPAMCANAPQDCAFCLPWGHCFIPPSPPASVDVFAADFASAACTGSTSREYTGALQAGAGFYPSAPHSQCWPFGNGESLYGEYCNMTGSVPGCRALTTARVAAPARQHLMTSLLMGGYRWSARSITARSLPQLHVQHALANSRVQRRSWAPDSRCRPGGKPLANLHDTAGGPPQLGAGPLRHQISAECKAYCDSNPACTAVYETAFTTDVNCCIETCRPPDYAFSSWTNAATLPPVCECWVSGAGPSDWSHLGPDDGFSYMRAQRWTTHVKDPPSAPPPPPLPAATITIRAWRDYSRDTAITSDGDTAFPLTRPTPSGCFQTTSQLGTLVAPCGVRCGEQLPLVAQFCRPLVHAVDLVLTRRARSREHHASRHLSG